MHELNAGTNDCGSSRDEIAYIWTFCDPKKATFETECAYSIQEKDISPESRNLSFENDSGEPATHNRRKKDTLYQARRGYKIRSGAPAETRTHAFQRSAQTTSLEKI